MEKWIVTGISGCGRIEMLEELTTFAQLKGKVVKAHDMGKLIRDVGDTMRPRVKEKNILEIDQNLLSAMRHSSLQHIKGSIKHNVAIDLHLIGVHATFLWKHRLIPGFSFQELLGFKPDGFINLVENVTINTEALIKNPNWGENQIPTTDGLQYWMMVEEYIAEQLADVSDKLMYLVATQHNISNFYDLFFSKKKKIYLSYPITEIEKADPSLLEKIQDTYLKALEKLFVVFNPLTIQDMRLTDTSKLDKLPSIKNRITPKSLEMIKKRTIERDFQFIDQSDAIVVIYLTDKSSPGVMAEMDYGHRHQKPIYCVYPARKSPFLELHSDNIFDTFEKMYEQLELFS